jgi:hypothetical protein
VFRKRFKHPFDFAIKIGKIINNYRPENINFYKPNQVVRDNFINVDINIKFEYK